MTIFAPAGPFGQDIGLTVTRPLFGQSWQFVLTVPQAQWSQVFPAISPNPAPAGPADAYASFVLRQTFWNTLAEAFADYAATLASPGAGTREIDGATPSLSWLTQYARWYRNIRSSAHPAAEDTPRPYAVVRAQCGASQLS